ncbi:MAG: substrate-binding domain-containing protein [Phycisphaerae bacterium]|nr:substrate-binding domain-containing protein [Phycisphaerae bacterium]
MAFTGQVTREDGKKPRGLHRQISNQILSDIRDGSLRLGDKLPSQAELMKQYDVSVTTVRQSLSTLEQRGIVCREQGRGCFVSLRSGQSGSSTKMRSAGLVFERTSEPENAPAEMEALLAFANVTRQKGLRLVTAEMEFDAHLSGNALLKTFDGASLDCICAYLHVPAEAAEKIAVLQREFKSAVVFFPTGILHEAMPVDCIDVDLRLGMRQLMNYFLSLGHRRIAYVGSQIEACLGGDEQVTSGRWQTYRDDLTRAGIALDTDLIVDIPYKTGPGPEIAEAIANLVRRDNPATAIFAANDWTARLVMYSLWQKGIHVPDDVSLAGLDNVSFAKELVPSLTTVAFPFEQAAETAIELMRRRLAQPDRPIQKVTLPAELIIRETVKAPKNPKI